MLKTSLWTISTGRWSGSLYSETMCLLWIKDVCKLFGAPPGRGERPGLLHWSWVILGQVLFCLIEFGRSQATSDTRSRLSALTVSTPWLLEHSLWEPWALVGDDGLHWSCHVMGNPTLSPERCEGGKEERSPEAMGFFIFHVLPAQSQTVNRKEPSLLCLVQIPDPQNGEI